MGTPLKALRPKVSVWLYPESPYTVHTVHNVHLLQTIEGKKFPNIRIAVYLPTFYSVSDLFVSENSVRAQNAAHQSLLS